MTTTTDDLRERAKALGLWGVLSHWDEVKDEKWVLWLIEAEEHERQQRSLQRRLSASRIGVFRPMADFDWKWPKEIDRKLVESLFDFGFLSDATNVVLVGPNGVGKSMIAKNLAHLALLKGHTVRFTTASAMLNDLASQDGTLALQRRLRFYSRPSILIVDEVGYLSYDTRHADLLFEVVSRRYQHKSVVVTTNKPFSEWSEVFPNASCVVALVDRLVHKAEIVQIRGASYRLKEAKQRQAKKSTKRSKGPGKRKP